MIMKGIIIAVLNFIILFIRLLLPGGIRTVAAENLALRKQLIYFSRGMKRSPKLKTSDRIIFGCLSSMISIKCLSKIAITLKPATLLKFHKALVQRKYSALFCNKKSRRPGPKGPSQLVISAMGS